MNEFREETPVQTGQQAPRKPRLACLPPLGRDRDRLAGTGGFTNEETVKDVSLVAVARKKKIDKDLTFLKIRGLLKAFFMLLKHGHLAQDVMTFTL